MQPAAAPVVTMSRVESFVLQGIEALPCEIEVDLCTRGLSGTTMVGLPDAAVRESLDRVKTASATRFLEARSSSVLATMLAHGLFWGIMIAAAQMAVVLATVLAVMLVQRGKKSAVLR